MNNELATNFMINAISTKNEDIENVLFMVERYDYDYEDEDDG